MGGTAKKSGKKSAKKSSKKKGKSKIKPHPSLTANDVNIFYDGNVDASDVVYDILEQILKKGSKIILDNIVARESVGQTATNAMLFGVEAAGAALLNHDFGEVSTINTVDDNQKMSSTGEPCSMTASGTLSAIQNWGLEEEPMCCEVDRFGRGMVSTKTRMKPLTMANLEVQNKETASGTSPATTGRSMLSTSSSRLKKKKTKKAPEKPLPMPKRIAKKMTLEDVKREANRIVELKKLDQKKRQKWRIAMQEQKVAEEKKRYEKIQKELRGKHYTVDVEGNVILIQTPNVDRMPSMTTTPNLDVTDLPEETRGGSDDENEEPSPTKTESNKTKTKTKKKRRNSVPLKSPNGREMFIDITTALGPALMTTFEPLEGVVLRQGLETKRNMNNKTETDTNKLTRAQYLQMLEKTHGKPLPKKQVSNPGSAASRRPGTSSSDPGADGDFGSGSLEPGFLEGLAPPASLAPLDPSALTPKKRLGSPGTGSHRSDSGGVVDDFDQQIMNNPTWGTQHQVASDDERGYVGGSPLSPSQRAQLRGVAMGQRARAPRDRPYHEQVTTQQRKHLPPSVYPSTMGHGFTVSDGVMLPSIHNKSSSSISSNNAPDLIRTGSRAELNKIVYEHENARELF